MLVQEKTALDKARTRADRPGARSDTPSTMFGKVLRAFATGDLSFSDLQSSLTRLLKDGAPPDELLRVLRWRESVEPLHPEARDKIIAALHEAKLPNAVGDAATAEQPAADSTDAARAPATEVEPDASSMSRLIQEFDPAWDTEPKVRPIAAAGAAPQGNEQIVDYKAMRLALGQREDDLAALQAEHSRVLGLLEARARSAANLQEEVRELAAKLEQTRGALLAQQGRIREIEDALAGRDAVIEQARALLAQRDAQLATLQGEHARLAPQIESGAQLAARLQAELAAAHARITELEAHAAAMNNARAAGADRLAVESDAWADRILAMQRSLDERSTALEAQKQQHAKVVASLMARGKAAEDELNAAQGRIAALVAELQTVGRAAASARERQRERAQAQAPEPAPAPAPEPAPEARLQPDFEHTMPLPQVEAMPPPMDDIAPGLLRLRRAVEIGDFSVPPARPPARTQFWKSGATARNVGICALIVVLAILAWVSTHHAPATAKIPEVAAPTSPAAGTVIRDCATCPPVTVLPAGRFKQGSADDSASPTVRPLHWVAISQPIAISTNAVTVDQFRAFVTATGRDMRGCDTYDGHWKHQPKNSWQNPGFPQAGTHPVTCASWNDAKAYAQWLSGQTGQHYRLPSASEWEYAARAGNEAVQPWRADGADACTDANVADVSAARRYPGWVAFACNDGYVFTAPVGTFKANGFGLNDMLGNVFQWTEDCWNANYKGAPIDGSARMDGNCSEHELRGGSWFSSPGYVRADYRNHFAANYRTSSAGIRLVRDITP